MSVRRDDCSAFSLIELVVILTIVGILIAIAIPLLLGAQTRSRDRATQSKLRNVYTAQQIYFAGERRYTAEEADLKPIEPAFSYFAMPSNGAIADAGDEVVFVEALDGPDPDDDAAGFLIGARSESGDCFWLKRAPGERVARFGANDCSGRPAAYTLRW